MPSIIPSKLTYWVLASFSRLLPGETGRNRFLPVSAGRAGEIGFSRAETQPWLALSLRYNEARRAVLPQACSRPEYLAYDVEYCI